MSKYKVQTSFNQQCTKKINSQKRSLLVQQIYFKISLKIIIFVHNHMTPLIVFISALIVCTIQTSLSFKDCNFTDLRFQSKYNLGKQDQLNNTFDAIAPRIAIPDVTYPVNSYTNYSFNAVKSSLQYVDSKQKAQIEGNDSILIDGGHLLATIQMKWKRTDFMQRGGSLQAVCKSDQIIFLKNLTISGGYLIYQVADYLNVSFDSQCKINRYDPANISDLDMGYIKQLLNKRDDGKDTAKSLLKNQIDKRFLYELNNSLYNEKHQLDDKLVYEWVDTIKNKTVSIQYQVLPTGVDLEKAGLSFTFVTEIKDDNKWQCGATIPHTNLDVNKYGGIQEFLSLSIFKNTLRYGIEAGALDTVLNKKTWSSRMFQFYAGDFYEVIPSITQKYIASQEITGICKGNPSNVTITPQPTINQLCAKTTHSCSLYIKGTIKLVDIDISLYTFVEAKFEEQAKVNFYVKDFSHSISYYEQPGFKVESYDLANAMVHNTLKNLLNTKTFGSGWPTFKMDLPELKVMPQGYVVLYDTSHVGDIEYQTS